MNKKIWFKAKNYGWGWYPSTWQGWLVLGAYLLIITGFALLFAQNPESTANIIIFVSVSLILTAILLVICWKTGEKPEWRWGPPKK